MTKSLIGTALCLLSLHSWTSSPRISHDEYATVIDHACDRCQRDRFDSNDRYSTRLDRWQHAAGIGPT